MSDKHFELVQVRILPKSSPPLATVFRGTKRLARQAEDFAALYRADPDDSGKNAESSNSLDDSGETSMSASDSYFLLREIAQEAAAQQKCLQGSASGSYRIPVRSNDESALSSRIVRACALGEETNLRTEYLAAIVARFCNSPSIIEGGAWELCVELNPSVLAETKLFLQLSSYRLSLRFETPNPHSKSLIYDNTDELCARLHSLLQEKFDVDVAIW